MRYIKESKIVSLVKYKDIVNWEIKNKLKVVDLNEVDYLNFIEEMSSKNKDILRV